jgi:DeoR family transcriptional regulator, aga operon transcriptional repressor
VARPEKQRIGRAAAAFLAPGSSVALNGGTTTSEVAWALATRPDLQDGDGAPAVTVVTNAMNIANELAVRQHIKIVVTRGVTRGQSYELIGLWVPKTLATWADSRGNASARGLRQVASGSASSWLCVG